MALMECESAEGYRVSFATATKEGCAGEISGDSVSAFTKGSKHAFGMICDGMGSGSEAQKFSAFAEDFLTATLGSGASYTTLIHMLNAFIRRGGSECSVALDIFTFDLVSGRASFLKSGAAASYIKRASGGLFRLRSETLPIGIIKKIDTEQIGVSVTEGDLIIMMSDGIAAGIDDAPWLINFLNRAPDSCLEDYAKAIINESLKYSRSTDDKSVIVAKIEKI
jgi:stage II sporulation protein E